MRGYDTIVSWILGIRMAFMETSLGNPLVPSGSSCGTGLASDSGFSC